ncbi:MAG TPA: hypothetical protein DD379_12035 [Cyanobacteria bacterium UBA11162]|nr:hypothetical protein [Cyanobacteria bacterium UBA11162]
MKLSHSILDFGFWILDFGTSAGLWNYCKTVVGCWLLVVGKLKTQNSPPYPPIPSLQRIIIIRECIK